MLPSPSTKSEGVQHRNRLRIRLFSSATEKGGPLEAMAKVLMSALVKECSSTSGANVSKAHAAMTSVTLVLL